MKKLLLSTLVLLSLFRVSAQKIENEAFILQIDELVDRENLTVLPWLKPNDNSWKKLKPTFQIQDPKSELFAKGWLAMTQNDLLIKVVVKDDQHINNKELGDIWNGDAIQIGIDVEGDGAGDMPKETPGMVGNDAGIGLAIGKNGPEVFAWFLGGNFVSTPLNKKLIKIERQETKKLTIYEIAIPFTELKLIPGTYSKMGFAIQVNDTDESTKEQNRISWGAGAGGNATPGLFQRLKISNPLNEFTNSYNLNQMIWKVGEYAEICFSTATMLNTTLTAKCENAETQIVVPSAQNLIAKRYSVKLFPKKLTNPLTFEAFITNAKKEIVGKQTSFLAIPDFTISDFNTRIDSLIAVPNNHQLFDRHLNSVKALVQTEWAKMGLYKSNFRTKKEIYKYIFDINEGLKSDAGKWESYLSNERTLTMAFISRKDNTLQYYSLDLPKNWDIKATYPLFFELHGSGNPNALSTLKSQLGSSTSSLDLFGYTSAKSYMQQQGIGYHVAPFGRGNSSYVGIGEIDIFEAYNDVHKIFKIDENKRYLYGFSMGGGGSWSVGIRTPDLWAAIGIFAGGLWSERSAASLGNNLKNTPVFIWCGDKDGLFAELPLMQKELEKYGNKPEVKTTKGMYHNYPETAQEMGLNWMMNFTRKRPNQFSFTADKNEHLGVWGISMKREEALSALPTFDCSIEGQTVKIESKGTNGLKINLGDGGLQMTGIVQVIWNGKKEYEGEVKELILGKQLEPLEEE
ncbi:MAG: hypothetical protein EAZ53_13335 [Bacteroidetes bacterium]|nr:MAG: hypothetical protein EAZ53_13335 [Bacteroidota bacterium]